MKAALTVGLLAIFVVAVLGGSSWGDRSVFGNERMQEGETRRNLVTVRVMMRSPKIDAQELPEPWVREALQRLGVSEPVAAHPWVPLAETKQRIFTSERGGVELDASVKLEEGTHVVMIEGCEGIELRKTVKLRPGETQVMPISEDGEAGSLYVAIAVNQEFDRPMAIQLSGTLRTGIVAIGGETTGTVLSTASGDFELDLAENQALLQQIETWDGKPVQVIGMLERRAGVEIRERWIVKVSQIELQE